MIKQIIAVRRDLKMKKGKIAAQVAHASISFLIRKSQSIIPNEIHTILNEDETDWIKGKFTKVVVGVDSEEQLRELIAAGKEAGLYVSEIVDAGNTVFHGVPTLTCAGFGPAKSEILDIITGHLSLL